ncbi:Zn-dependent amino- or carboxypeptidase, M28 family [Maribacter sedimenticola]|uniref:Zn-dependent amino- or carboxypeptidase, M28 family n=1 Tax=Maribacter sedimenticola TaxID=228956 RepID=A0ABY1SD06_9FLAO|nr:M28 family peptidase [Maribacter sedimenticola]SNR25312.1 Zn-dependent amino- or carboxypeptidase, M28 family [Maribacter sedimenticola]
MKKGLLLLVLYGTLLSGCAQDIQEKSIDFYGLVRQHFTGKTAFATTDYVEDYWRVVGNTGFNNTIYLLADSLQAAGYVLEENAEEGDRLTYRIERRPMDHQTWEPISASLHIVGEDTPLLQADTNRNMTYLHSPSTPKEGISAEVVWIKSMHDLTSVSLKNKVVFAEMNGRQLYNAAIKKGALGMLTYDNPSYLQPEKNTTSIQFRSLPSQSDPDFWGIALSYEAKEKLVAKLTKGTTKVVAHIQTKKYPSEELTIVADIKGSTLPNERLVYSAHIQEPGANDNATGVGAQLEMAMIAAKLVSEGKIELQRTMTFLWGDEIISTRRYIEENPNRAKGIKWGISLDMVGENTTVTGGTFLIEKMPDPSAIWTRGNDKHSEWGGEVMSMEEMRPHYLNDFIITTFKEQGKFANWVVETNPFEGGSDHTPFLNANIPGLLLWHFTDQFYHTDNDRIDKVSQKTLRNVGTAALVSGLKLVNAESGFALEQIATLEKKALLRLQDEYDLSISAIEKGENPAEQLSILTAWKDWYIAALHSTQDVLSNTSLTKKQLNGAKAKIEKKYEEKKKQLVK